MAGFEIVVRPVVFPNIRPTPAQTLPPADDPAKGICEIKGAGSFVVSFSVNTSLSVTFARPTEMSRRVTRMRVYQQSDDGSINRDNFVDLDVPTRIRSTGGSAPAAPSDGGGAPGASGRTKQTQYYQRPKITPNIEILQENIEQRAPEAGAVLA